MERLVADARPLLDRYGYPALFAVLAAESVLIPGPGQTLLIAAGAAAGDGLLDLRLVLATAFAGTLLGSLVGYQLGRQGGRGLLLRLPLREERLRRIERLFGRLGPAVALVGRFPDGIRQTFSVVSGALAMPARRFALWTTLGAALYVGVWGLAAYLVERHVATLAEIVDRLEPWLIAAALLAAGLALAYLLRRRGPERSS
jgi:membrane protein DedA with SNARE-associated domain